VTNPVHSEDIEVGATTALGDHRVSLEEIKDFSARWDPQPFHTDESAAESGYFGEPIASGLHSLSILQRLAVLGLFSGWAVLAGRRIREVGFLAPVRPGMVLTGSMTVDAVAHSSPERSLVTVTGLLHHQGAPVLSAVHQLYVWRRPLG
jgi:acyl dehydratase